MSEVVKVVASLIKNPSQDKFLIVKKIFFKNPPPSFGLCYSSISNTENVKLNEELGDFA